MLKSLGSSLIVKAMRKGTGVSSPETLTTGLLTTGASLLLVRGRRPIGLVLLAIGGLMLWREAEVLREAGVPREAGKADQAG